MKLIYLIRLGQYHKIRITRYTNHAFCFHEIKPQDVSRYLNPKMRSIFIFGFFILLHCSGCASTKKIIFIHDKVNTTTHDADWLLGKVKELSTKCSRNGYDFQFQLSFPYRSPDLASSNEGEFTLNNLLTYLKESPPYSAIYVMTNVTSPSDETSVEDILEEIQIKRTEVNFLIGKECTMEKDYKTQSLVKYRSITFISNGYIMGPNSFQSDQFTDSMYLRLTSVSLNMKYPIVLHQDDETYCAKLQSSHPKAQKFMTDNKLDLYEYEIIAGNLDRSYVNRIEWNLKAVAYTMEWCDSYNKTFNTTEIPISSERGLAKSQFEFDYGFSTKYVRSMKETYRRPINGTSNKIYVSAIDKSVHHKFINFKIIFLEYNFFEGTDHKFRTIHYGEEIPLQPVFETDMYVGSFEPPNQQYFYIQVMIHTNDVEVFRISSTAMTAATGFGDDHRNPMFEQNPGLAFETQPEYIRLKNYVMSCVSLSVFSNQILVFIVIGSLGVFVGGAVFLLRTFRTYVLREG